MRILASICLLLHFILLDHYYVTAQLFDDLENENYDLFAPDGLGDQATLSQLSPVDALSNGESYLPLFSDVDLASDFSIFDCSSESNQYQPINKRLDPDSEKTPQLCRPRSETKPSNDGDSTDLESFPDPLVKVQRYEPDDEEFCASRSGFPTFLVCDSGRLSDRGRNQLSWKYHLNNCQRSTYHFYQPLLTLRLHPCGGLPTS